jgi:aminobenzoyl-glutamate transport protein
MFVALCLLVIVVSAILSMADVQVPPRWCPPWRRRCRPRTDNYPYYPRRSIVPDGPADPRPVPTTTSRTSRRSRVKSLLDVAGIRFIFTSFVDNFNNFSAVGVIIIAMIGVGLAEEAG